MSYIEPTTVRAPKVSVRSVQVLRNTGPGGWSVARVKWEEEDRIGIRWNGSDDDTGIGNPQSRGNATWFLLPPELENVVLDCIEGLSQSALAEEYAEMANDFDREREAEAWSEGLIGDASPQR
jgi:hypothetical protein